MTPAPQATLEAFFAHPLRHNIRWDHLRALWQFLGGEIERLDQQRLRLRLPDGSESWLHHAAGRHHAVLSADDVLRVRRLLQAAGVHPHLGAAAAESAGQRGDQARRLVIRLNHRRADVYRFVGDGVEQATLQPHGLWASDQNLTHRHDRDLAGQRAPLDHDYLSRLTGVLETADRVLVVGHGHGEASLIHTFLHHVAHHRPELLERISATETLDDSALSEAQLLAHAREHFGNLPHRRPLRIPGQPIREGLARDASPQGGAGEVEI
jgi:hypothetical protein